MTVVETGEALRHALGDSPGPRVLVPTMGALHDGHLELIRRAKAEAGANGTVIVSLFVNPIQFDRPSDLENYPRRMDEDLAACSREGVDLVFSPAKDSMYSQDHSVIVTESLLSKGLCGATRPGHFDGVCTVVLKLVLLTRCDVAVFGEKDFQQLAVVRRMVRDLDVPVRIAGHPTVRDADGLALSSRNVRLSDAQRKDAPVIRRSLLAAVRLRDPAAMIDQARRDIGQSGLARIDYLSLVDAETLEETHDLMRPAILATAVFYGEVRLIDHIEVPAVI